MIIIGGIKMKIYGREDGDLKTIIPYFSLEQVHIVADLEEIDIIINSNFPH